MKYSKLIPMDFVNGKGLRTTLFVSGCSHYCKGCFNQNTWDRDYGKEFDEEVQNEIIMILKGESPKVDGLSLLGGCPMCEDNARDLLPFIKRVKEEVPTTNIWCWCGETIEEIYENDLQYELLQYIDVLVDGKYEESKRDVRLPFRGSSNQRVIDVKKSSRRNIVLL